MLDPNRKLNPRQKLLTAEQFRKLVENGKRPNDKHFPVVKFFGGAGTWLVDQIDENGIAWGLADLQMDCCEYGSISLDEMCDPHGRHFPWVERDLHFTGTKPIMDYLEDYNKRGTLAGI
jgi:hypothetical protein